MSKTASDYLKQPYGRVLTPEADGTYRAEIVEFPGCIAVGDTAADAFASLETVAESWLEATLDKGLRIPGPSQHPAINKKLLHEAELSLGAAIGGSCTCGIKSAHWPLHAAYCRYLKIANALDTIEELKRESCSLDTE